MSKLLRKYAETSLILRILTGIAAGVLLGLAVPGFTAVGMLGTLFVGALKGIAPLLVFLLVLSSIANAAGNIGSRFRTVIVLYMISTLAAAVVAVLASFLFPVTITLAASAAAQSSPGGIGEILKDLLSSLVQNPGQALSNGNYVGILFWVIIFGMALKKIASPATLSVIRDFADMVSTVVSWIIQCAPFGVMGIIFKVVSENGLACFQSYGMLLLLLVGTMIFVALLVNPLLVFLVLRRNPYPLVLQCLRESGVTAFFTRSSAANIPVNMALCEKLGLERDFYSVAIPLGATINMDGAAITITIMTLAAAHTLGISFTLPSAIMLSVIATLAACGSSGVTGGSLLLIPMACSLFSISNDIAMQVVGVGFIIGVVQDSIETALNSSGDVLFTATAEYYDRMEKEKAKS